MTFDEYLKPFADAVGKTISEITEALKPEIGDPSEQAIEVLSNEEFTPFESLKTALAPLSIPSAILRKSVSLLRKKEAVSEMLLTGATILPSIPDDSSFLEALKVGGVLKVGITEIILAIKVVLAKKAGLYEIPSKLADNMEKFAETCEEPVGSDFIEVRNMVIERSYAEVMSVLGIKGQFVTEARRNAFFNKLNASLWNEIKSFYDRLVGWNQTWITTSNNPNILINQLATLISRGTAGVAPSVIQPPDTSVLKDSAESLITVMNRIFAGYGIPIARALAFEAHKIKTILENDKIPSMIGAPTRELMLKMLGSDVTNDYIRLERNMVQFVVAVMEYPKVGPQTELLYLSDLLKIGSAIDFNKLTGGTTEGGSRHKAF